MGQLASIDTKKQAQIYVYKPGQIVRQKRCTSGKVHFRPDIRQTFLKTKIRTSISNLGQHMLISISRASVVSKEHLVTFCLTFFAYASKLKLQLNINLFIAKAYHFIQHARRKTTLIYKQGVKHTITKENEGSFFNDYVQVT